MAIRTAWNDFARRPRKDVICINNTVWATGSTFVQLKNRPVQIYICPRCKCERGQRIDTARRDDATTLSCRWDECLSLLSHIERNYGREIWYLPSFFISRHPMAGKGREGGSATKLKRWKTLRIFKNFTTLKRFFRKSDSRFAEWERNNNIYIYMWAIINLENWISLGTMKSGENRR